MEGGNNSAAAAAEQCGIRHHHDDDDVRRPGVEATYASNHHASKLYIAARAAFEAIQRVEAERAASRPGATKSPETNPQTGEDTGEDKASPWDNKSELKEADASQEEAKDINMMDISEEMSSVNFFRGSFSDQSNATASDDQDISASPKRKSIIGSGSGNTDAFNAIEYGPPALKRSRSDIRVQKQVPGSKPIGGKTAVLQLIRARSEGQRVHQALQEEDDESIRLHGEIQVVAQENRELWSVCDAGRKGRMKTTHNTNIRVVHEATCVMDENEVWDDAGLILFEAAYHSVLITAKDDEDTVTASIVKSNKPVQSMMPGLAKSIPAQFSDWIFSKEATADGFILAYRISPTLYRLCGEAERVKLLRDFKKHVSSLGKSLTETHQWLQKAATWNKHLEKKVESLSTESRYTSKNAVQYCILRKEAKALELALNEQKPSEIEKVVIWEYDLS
eukprot:CAMPEP_0181043120 /NCGR_PEP_ID=MMETSP1070-20121207/12534_1 /TAXON_ID=265543 /ORGANISM="Minutocellus polymorphus, Strain NH13" /LENGTH=449 /DNA_ID=CAMNT_0023121419 /DNA_START=152 /DNA_END=1501 /DNA_ORIENTATION=+